MAATRDTLGFLLAKASQHWNELLEDRFTAAGYGDVRPAYGSVLLPLYEQDDLRMGELAARSRLAKQTMTTLARLAERDGLVSRRVDPRDARATLVSLTERSRAFRPIVEATLDELDALAAEKLGRAEATRLGDLLKGVMAL